MIEKILKNKLVILGILGLFYWWKHGKMGIVQIDKVLLIDLLVFMIILIGDGYQRAWKYDSPQVVSPSSHHSYDGTIYPAGEYVLIQLGGILTDWRMEGKDGTIVLPRDKVFQGEGVVITPVVVEETDLRALPPSVFQKIRREESKFKPPYYYGTSTISAWTTDPDEVAQVNQKIETLNMRINWYQEEFPQAVSEIDHYFSHMKRTVEGDKFLAKLRWGKEENE